MTRIIAGLFLCLAFAPAAHAQSFDCSSPLMQRVCAAPELIPLEEERRQLIGELQFIDATHPAIQGEGAFLASQEACADTGCLVAGYAEHNQALRAALAAMQAPEELVEAPEEAPPPVVGAREVEDTSRARLDDAPTGGIGDYLSTIIIWLATLGIALWLVTASGRARRADRGE